jgi:hypothetical protein
MRLVRHIVYWEKLEIYEVFLGQLEEREHSGDLGRDGNVFNDAVNS